MSEDETPDRHAELIGRPIEAFRASLQTIIDLVAFISENSDRIYNSEESFVREAKRSHSEDLEEQHRTAARLYHDHVHAVVDARRDVTDQVERKRIGEEYRETLSKEVRELCGNDDDYWRYWQIWQDTQRRPSELFVLTKSLFISAVSDFEVLVANTIRAQLTLRPEILNISEQRYSLSDLKGFSTIAEFQNYCAEEFADSVMRGGFDEWVKWFGKRHKLEIDGVTTENDALIEIFQRRHLLVHAGGIVNEQYIARCGDTHEKGQELTVGRKYLVRSADLLLAAGVKLMSVVGLTLGDDATKATVSHSVPMHLGYQLLKSRRYAAARNILEWYLPRTVEGQDRLMSQVNLWLAKQGIDGVDSVKSEVDAWDVSVLDQSFKLAKHCLLSELDAAYALAAKMVSAGDLEERNWREWPLLETLRRYEAESGQGPLFESLTVVPNEHEDGEPVHERSSLEVAT